RERERERERERGGIPDKFLATLRLGDSNDYISPSQGCVVSLEASSTRQDKSQNLEKVGTALNEDMYINDSLYVACFVSNCGFLLVPLTSKFLFPAVRRILFGRR
ncbi:unnamed protein product, partial [Ilex paraguariensis]